VAHAATGAQSDFAHPAPSHSITSSAMASTPGARVRPCAAAVFKLITIGGLLDRQIGGLGASEYFIDVERGAAPVVEQVRAIARKPAGLGNGPELAHDGQSLPHRKFHDARALR
jgi:hypothetical protein